MSELGGGGGQLDRERYHTMYKYMGRKLEKIQNFGVGVGSKCLILPIYQKFVVNALARKDRSNEGLMMAENIYLILDIFPKLSRVQAQRSFVCTIQPNNRHLLK